MSWFYDAFLNPMKIKLKRLADFFGVKNLECLMCLIMYVFFEFDDENAFRHLHFVRMLPLQFLNYVWNLCSQAQVISQEYHIMMLYTHWLVGLFVCHSTCTKMICFSLCWNKF